MIHVNRRFIQWCRLHGINPGQTFIGAGHLHVEDWAELSMKAYTTRVFTTYMSVCLRALITSPAFQATADVDLQLICLATQQLSNWMLDLETKPLELSQQQADSLYDAGMTSLDKVISQFCFIFSSCGFSQINEPLDSCWQCCRLLGF